MAIDDDKVNEAPDKIRQQESVGRRQFWRAVAIISVKNDESGHTEPHECSDSPNAETQR